MISAAERVRLARAPERPVTSDYIDNIFDEFFPLAGDRLHGEDKSILGGIGSLDGIPVTVIGQLKGRTIEENIERRFGMASPEGYRKAQRLMKQAEKFHRPVITFVDTPGAYPGIEAEAEGQGEAIARSLAVMGRLKTPCISVFIGEGGSGGALALAVSDRIIMLENSIFSILSPEGFASILWKDSSRWEEAAEAMKLTAGDLKELGVCDVIVPEPAGGVTLETPKVFARLREELLKTVSELSRISSGSLVEKRYRRLRMIDRAAKKKPSDETDGRTYKSEVEIWQE